MGAYSDGMFKDGQLVDAYYVHASPYGSSYGNLRVYIPGPMSEIGMGTCRYTPQAIDSSTLLNTSECKPNVSKRIDTQNWFTAKAPNFPYAHSLISYGARLKVRVSINDSAGIDFKLVSEEADPSWDPPID